MHEHSLEDRRLFWRMSYAKAAFSHCQTICRFIIDENIGEESAIYYPLICALHVCYSKPFKLSRGIGKLTEEIIPPDYLYIHQMLIHMRDKIFAHTDSDAVDYEDSEVANEVRFVFDGKYLNTKITVRITLPVACEQILELCDVLIAKGNYSQQGTKVLKRHLPRMRSDSGPSHFEY